MRVFKNIPDLKENTSIALGLFDGLHAGHQKVIKEAVKENSLQPVVFSFEFGETPVKPDFSYILSPTLKEKILESLKVSSFVCPLFSDIQNIEYYDFFNEILLKKLNAKALFCGEDYRFGKDAKGDVSTLKALCEKNNIALHVIPDMLCSGKKISATSIRKALKSGDLKEVKDMLGRDYEIDFPVTNGNKIGRTLGYPTINQVFPKGFTVLKFGVYLTKTWIDGNEYYGLTNVGVKPTVDDNSPPSAETTILGYTGDLYGQKINLKFLEFLREEKKFPSLETLKSQIEKDIKTANEIIKGIV